MGNIRSQFIEEVLKKQSNLDRMMQEATNSTMETLLAEKVSDSIRNFLNEESEKDVDEKPIDDEDKDLLTDDEDGSDGIGAEDDSAVEDFEGEEDDLEGDDDIWNDIEDLKNDEGAYDLRGMDIGELSKYVGTLGPNDGVTVEFEDGEMTIDDEVEDREIEIDLEGALEGDEDAISVNDGDFSDDEEDEIELELDDEEPEFGDDDMAGEDEDEFEIELDDEDPEFGDDEDILSPEDEEAEIDLELDDEDEPELEETLSRGKVTDRSTTMGRFRRNASRAGKEITDSTEEEYDANPGTMSESAIRKMNAILKENAALKKLIPQIQEQLNMASVVNTSLGNIVKLVNEHTTTTDEKKQLVERFNKCKTSEDSNKLYEQIRIEYANANKSNTNNFSAVLNGQIKEAVENPLKNTLNETAMNRQPVADEGLYASWEFMERLNKIK